MAGHSSCVIGDKMIVFGGSLGSRQMSNEVWVLDLEQWAWSKPNISGPSPHPRGGQSQIVIDDTTLLILGGCGGPNAMVSSSLPGGTVCGGLQPGAKRESAPQPQFELSPVTYQCHSSSPGS
ncbi:F-box protein 42, isoform CRA_a [Mus musculus]|nr:F-box protein 42, isoform CRA_a [Mus musculus]EDL13350.1 F-box protein 42, isoform CRA_a [Mus musculus]